MKPLPLIITYAWGALTLQCYLVLNMTQSKKTYKRKTTPNPLPPYFLLLFQNIRIAWTFYA